jgi:hypothetical protein
MKTADSMQAIIEKLAAKHGLDLTATEAHLRLEQPSYMPLVIEKIAKHQVSVSHYFEQNGDLIADPDVVFFTAYGAWIPTEITQCFGGFARYVQLSDSGEKITGIAAKGQADLASFCRMWARNLKEQGWLEDGIRSG